MQAEAPTEGTSINVSALLLQYRVYLFFGSTAVLFLITAALAFNQTRRQASDLKQHTVELASKASQVGLIYVDVAGAVMRPGVYALPLGSRVEQAIAAAGGFDEAKVSKDFVAKDMNFAQKLTDGQKIYVLHEGESKVGIPSQALAASTLKSGQININAATTQELDSLPGVGAVTAQKIIQARPYQAVEDLIAKKVVSASVFAKIKDSITAQ